MRWVALLVMLVGCGGSELPKCEVDCSSAASTYKSWACEYPNTGKQCDASGPGESKTVCVTACGLPYAVSYFDRSTAEECDAAKAAWLTALEHCH